MRRQINTPKRGLNTAVVGRLGTANALLTKRQSLHDICISLQAHYELLQSSRAVYVTVEEITRVNLTRDCMIYSYKWKGLL